MSIETMLVEINMLKVKLANGNPTSIESQEHLVALLALYDSLINRLLEDERKVAWNLL